jgi:hypothetical protein
MEIASRTHVATDGEMAPTRAPLAYRCVPDALRVVMPALPANAVAGYARIGRGAR